MAMMNNLYKWMVYVGLDVLTLNGWSTRGSSSFAPIGSLAHWIAGPRNVRPGRRPSLSVIRDGHSTLPGPLANDYMGRAGEVVLVAAGRCNHAGYGYWKGATGNTVLMGTEPEAADNNDWTAEQRKSYPLIKIAHLFAMWEKGLISWNQITSNRIAGHSEFALPKGRKVDVNGYTMTSMRSQIAALIPGFKKRVNRKAISVGTPAVFNRDTYTFTDGTTSPTPTTERTWLDMVTKDELRSVIRSEILGYIGNNETRDLYSFIRTGSKAAEAIQEALADLPKEVWKYRGKDEPTDAYAYLRGTRREVAALEGANQGLLKALEQAGATDLDAIRKATEEGVEAALQSIEADVRLNVETGTE